VRPVVPALPPNAPRSRGNAFTRWFGRAILRVGGWRMVGEWPDVRKVVVIVAPHSSGWDGLWGLAAKVAPGGIVDQVAQQLRDSDQMWFVLAPEGTRKPVERWKQGFWKIAKKADVPVFCAWFHYPDKVIGLGPMVALTDDVEADLVRIRALFKGHMGKKRGA